MGAMGRYIDSLDDAGKDRLIEATQWCTGVWYDDDGAGCLIGHGHNIVHSKSANSLKSAAKYFTQVFTRFDIAVVRFGKTKVVCAIKARAARNNTIDTSKHVAVSSESQSESLTLVGV